MSSIPDVITPPYRPSRPPSERTRLTAISIPALPTIFNVPALRALVTASLLRSLASNVEENRNARRLIPFFFRPAASNPDARQKTLYTLQIGRGIAAVAVLLYHANLIIGLPKYFGSRPADIFMPGRAGVHYFFVLSGFIIIVAHWRDLTGTPDIASFAWKRFRRIYPLLWIVLIPLMGLIAINPSFSPAGTALPWQFLTAPMIAPPLGEVYVEPFLVAEWTLRYEIIFYILFLVLLKSRTLFAILVLPLLIGSVASLASTAEEPTNFWIAPFFLLFFMGMAGGWAFKSLPTGRPAWVLVAGLVGLIACGWVAYRTDITPLLSVAIGLASTLVVVGAAWGEKGRPSAVARAFIFLGDASYSIYLVNYPLLSISTKILTRLTDSPYVAFTGAAGLTLAGGIGCHLMIERPLLRRLPRRPPVMAALQRKADV